MVHRGVGKGGTFPWRRITMGVPNHCGGRRMTAEDAGKSQQCHKYFLKYNAVASDRSQSRTGVPNLAYMYPQGYICLSEGVHLRLAIEDKNIFACYLFPKYLYIFIYISVNIIFKNHYMLIVKYIWIIIKYFVIRNIRDTCSTVEMLKEYIFTCRNAEGVHGNRKVGDPACETCLHRAPSNLVTSLLVQYQWCLHHCNCLLFIIILHVTDVHVMLKRMECEIRVCSTTLVPRLVIFH